MLVDDFDFDLPPHLIAQRPSPHRGESRLMSVSSEGSASFMPFSHIISEFKGNEILVVNDTRVVPARVIGQKKTGGRVEVFFLEQTGPNQIIALTKGKIKPGQEIELPLKCTAIFEQRDELGRAHLSLNLPEFPVFENPLQPIMQDTPLGPTTLNLPTINNEVVSAQVQGGNFNNLTTQQKLDLLFGRG